MEILEVYVLAKNPIGRTSTRSKHKTMQGGQSAVSAQLPCQPDCLVGLLCLPASFVLYPIYIHTFVHLYTHARKHTYTGRHTYAYMYGYKLMFICIYKYVCVCVCKFVSIRVCSPVHIHVCVYTCTYVYPHVCMNVQKYVSILVCVLCLKVAGHSAPKRALRHSA
jgi:hypothetical protein